jgi:predicted AAA+ superfamily ATPase
VYRLPILSLREFLELKLETHFDSFELNDLLTNHLNISADIISKIKPLKYYDEYIRYGAYPFFLEGKSSYFQRLVEIINETLTFDIATIYKVPFTNIDALKRLLEVICRSHPYEINYEAISKIAGISKNTLKQYIVYLNKANLISSIGGVVRGNSYIKKPDKLYLNNTNLFEVLCDNREIGTIRETFFNSQLRFKHKLYYPKAGDFLVDEKYIFEIGGKNKSFKQIRGIENSFVVSDDIEIGFGNKIPLWLFGFLY